MSDESTSTALERTTAGQISAGLISDDEVRRMYRIAEALAMSGSFKGITKAEQAFAKMIVGREFGMTPAQSMLGLHLVDGQVMVHYAMLGRFIRERADEGYRYRHAWIKEVPVSEQVTVPVREFVWANEDDPTDTREVVGASVWFWGEGGEHVGISTFTKEDAIAIGKLNETGQALKTDGSVTKASAWATARRNMFLARALSNGVKWYVPEVMGGLPVYVEGEIVEAPSVTEPVGEGGDEGTGLDLGPKVDAIIERARQLGHRGLSNRGALELALGNRAPGVVNQWIRDATAELDRYEQEKAEPEPEDADVVEEDPIAAAEERPVSAEGTLAEEAADEHLMEDMQTQALRNRLERLEEARSEEQNPEQRRLIDEEMEHIKGQLEGEQ